jgi:hypothetical protein
MSGMGGGGAGRTAWLARMSWLLLRGQGWVNGAADAMAMMGAVAGGGGGGLRVDGGEEVELGWIGQRTRLG